MGVGAFVFLLISYHFALGRTISCIKQNKKLKVRIVLAENAPNKVSVLQSQIDEINYLLGTVNTAITDNHINILKISSEYVKERPIEIINYPKEHVFNENGYLLSTNKIIVRGSFIELLKFLHYMEKGQAMGKVVSSAFYVENDRIKRKKRLMLKIFFQNITYDGNER